MPAMSTAAVALVYVSYVRRARMLPKNQLHISSLDRINAGTTHTHIYTTLICECNFTYTYHHRECVEHFPFLFFFLVSRCCAAIVILPRTTMTTTWCTTLVAMMFGANDDTHWFTHRLGLCGRCGRCRRCAMYICPHHCTSQGERGGAAVLAVGRHYEENS